MAEKKQWKVGERDLFVLLGRARTLKSHRDSLNEELQRIESELFAVLWAGSEAIKGSGGYEPERQLGDTESAKALLTLAKGELE